MADVIPVPSLSLDGWVLADAQRADYLISHFFLSLYSQTQIYPTNVASLPYLIQSNQDQPGLLADKTQATLYAYFSRYFGGVAVEVSCKQASDLSSKWELSIFVSFQGQDGNTYSLGREVNFLDSKILKITDINNG